MTKKTEKNTSLPSFAHKNHHAILNQKMNTVLWRLSLPAIIAMVLYGLNSFLDSVFVGQLINETALAGVSAVYPLTNLMLL